MHYRTAVLLVLALAGSAAALEAQAEQQRPAQTAELSRNQLQSLLDRLDEAARSPGYSLRMRQRASAEAQSVRGRLATGDFRVGERILLQVQGDQPFVDTLTVKQGPVVTVTRIGDVSLKGVLRSELQNHMTTEISRYIRGVTVHATLLMRVTVEGQVANQGFYALPATALLENAVMAAGGPTANADLTAIEIQRGDRTIWSGEPLQQAIIAGRTLNELDVRAGDRIIIPARRGGILPTVTSFFPLVPAMIFLLTNIL